VASRAHRFRANGQDCLCHLTLPSSGHTTAGRVCSLRHHLRRRCVPLMSNVRLHMAGLPSATITFSAATPQLDSIAPRVQQSGGLPVEARIEHGRLRLHFVCIPEDEIEVRAQPGKDDGLVVTDWSLQGGSLYRLVCQVLMELGGVSPGGWKEPLRLPLTEAHVRRERHRISFASTLVVVALGLAASGVVAGVLFILWTVIGNAI